MDLARRGDCGNVPLSMTGYYCGGRYVDFGSTPEGDLLIELSNEGKHTFEEIERIRQTHGWDAAFAELLEDHLTNGWEIVPPEDIGALTSAPILSNEIERDDHGKIIEAGRVFWYPDYQVLDAIDELRKYARVVFQCVGDDEADEPILVVS